MSEATDKATLERPLLRHRDQRAVAALTLLAMAGMAMSWLTAGQLTEVEGRPRRTVPCQIDVNTASWPELTLLPRIARKMSHRIVASREADGPFLNADGLERVHRIGKKTVARMKPYLTPFDTLTADAGR